MTRSADIDEFIAMAVTASGEQCIVWPFHYTKDGYPERVRRFDGVRRQKRRVNRIVCEMSSGPAPLDRPEAAHKCGNKRCVNASHIYWGSRSENAADMLAHGTVSRGSRRPSSKLTEDQIPEIKRLSSAMTQTEIAQKFGVNQSQISRVLSGKRWKHT
jgi:hypothetical protein